MKTLAKIVLAIWMLIVFGGFLLTLIYGLIKDTEGTITVVLLGCGIMFFVFSPFWAIDQLSK